MVVPIPAIDPGLITQTPVAGSPLRKTLPVGEAHVEGCVIVPTIGAGGASGAGFITTAWPVHHLLQHLSKAVIYILLHL